MKVLTIQYGGRYLHTQIPQLVPVLQSAGDDDCGDDSVAMVACSTDLFDATREHICRAVLMAAVENNTNGEVLHLTKAQAALRACQYSLDIGSRGVFLKKKNAKATPCSFVFF